MNGAGGWALPTAAAIVFAAALTMAGTAMAQTVMKQEPPSGALKRRTVVLVDDGSCPRGQIKEVIAGAGQGAGSTTLTRRCVKRR